LGWIPYGGTIRLDVQGEPTEAIQRDLGAEDGAWRMGDEVSAAGKVGFEEAKVVTDGGEATRIAARAEVGRVEGGEDRAG